MKYTINYTRMAKEMKQATAIQDIGVYSPKVLNLGFKVATEANCYEQFSIVMSFMGVSGYPNTALWEYVRQMNKEMSE